MKDYGKPGHDYVCNYSLSLSLTWVLTMSPLMTSLLFVEIDTTVAASIKFEYLISVVCFLFTAILNIDIQT